MGTIYQSMTELIGRTPLLAARRFEKANDLAAKLLVVKVFRKWPETNSGTFFPS